MSVKPILFIAEMVRALLNERKTATRRVVKLPRAHENIREMEWSISGGVADFRYTADIAGYGMDVSVFKSLSVPYCPGDILYVRETWAQVNESIGMGLECKKYIYRANYSDAEAEGWKWRPSIHMPREAARIWLRVTDVRVERLQKITASEAKAEGCEGFLHTNPLFGCAETVHNFKNLWDSTVKPSDRERCGWAANPFCWVISFERISKDEAMQ